jgi:uncharacterized protein (DUF433 family)
MLHAKLAGLALSGLLALGGIGLTAGDSQAAAAIQEIPGTVLNHLRGFRGPQIPLVNPGERDEAIAGALGITVAELQEARDDGIRLPELATDLEVDLAEVVDALQSLLIEEVEEAVEAGDMTQERADRILERIEVANVMRDYFGWEAHLEVLADSLDMTTDELLAAREAGTRLRELLDEADVSPEEIRDAMSTAREEAIEQAFEDGALTEEQMERLLDEPGWFVPRGLRDRFFRFNPPAGREGVGPLPAPLLGG